MVGGLESRGVAFSLSDVRNAASFAAEPRVIRATIVNEWETTGHCSLEKRGGDAIDVGMGGRLGVEESDLVKAIGGR